MVKGIRRNEFSSCLKKCNTRFRPFTWATIKQIEIYIKPIIQLDTPDLEMLHEEWNDISKKNMSANEGIINIGRYCKEHNVSNVTISSMIYWSIFYSFSLFFIWWQYSVYFWSYCIIHSSFSPRWPILAAKYHSRQRIIPNSVETYVLIKSALETTWWQFSGKNYVCFLLFQSLKVINKC